MRSLLLTTFILLTTTLMHAHVGSADVFYEGDAGPYHVFVTIRLPQVVPGVSQIQVRSASPDVQAIRVVLLRLTGPGAEFPPTPDLAQRSKDDPQFFVSNLWFLDYGALQVRLEVEGARGKAQLSIPVASYSRQNLPMGPVLRGLGLFFIVFLTCTIVPIIGAVARDGTVLPGEVVPPSNRRRSRIFMAATLAAVSLVFYSGRSMWIVAATKQERNVDLLKPPRAETKLLDGRRLMIRPASQLMVPVAGEKTATIKINMDDLVPDHGHLMHLFLIHMPAMDRMWHLHPDRDGDAFAKTLPAMPAGQYQIFADIVDKYGYPWTLVGNMDLPQIQGSTETGDDSAWEGTRLTTPLAENTVTQLPDGARMVWERDAGPLRANVPASFRFRVEGKDGSPARDLEPYMGMEAHAEVIATDLSVFAHIHPAGSVSMAALDMAQAELMTPSSPAGSGMAMKMAHSSHALPPNFSFPYGFPHSGDYRIFVQIKRAGEVQTAAFDAHVQ